ncbi:MAG: TraM recognition domain-containing protein [Tetragenococcus koreensis]|nr:TraM recognition domain-containing protein [Tetragenococcus koreensis]MDN6146069.1 TraM recognition domain-containing protein [Tetragenococcus koreensis]MDN6268229.1 TraM recognition domain-containing protein [Tetragenococcus koreensis]MDN6580502.1 TraM recognition domain-containing protein [Tetragenococcus koreensis]MDN6599753.1 TraM recognition domain-containing protein [Tetragenococcus koreensis]
MFDEKDPSFASGQSEVDKSIEKMAPILFLGVLVLVSVFLFLPTLFLSLIITGVVVGFNQYKNLKRAIYIALPLFLIVGYFESFRPLMQFPIIFKSQIPLDWYVNLINNGQPLVINIWGYIEAILASVPLAFIWTFIYRKFLENRLTLEKEEKKDKLLKNSNIANNTRYRDKVLRKSQKNYRKSNDTDVFLGLKPNETEVSFDTEDLFKHVLVQGTTGTGKTYLMYNILEKACRDGLGAIFVDGKGDKKTVEEVERLAKAYDREVYVFSDTSKWHYNPVKYGKPTAITDRLMAVMDWSEQFYENESRNTLQSIISFLQAFDFPNDIETIYSYLDLEKVGNFLLNKQERKNNENVERSPFDDGGTKEITADESVKRFNRLFFHKDIIDEDDVESLANNRDQKMKMIQGLRTQLEMLIYSDLGQKFQEKEGATLDIKEAIKNHAIVLFSLDSNNYEQFIGTIGRFIVSDCAYVTTELYGNTDNFNGVLGFFDEFGSYGNDNILDILSKARSAKFGAILGIQSIGDLKNKRKNIDIQQQAIDNCNLFLLGRTNDAENAEQVAKLIGTYEDIDRTTVTENKGSMFKRIETKQDRGTVRKVNKFHFSPDKIKSLPDHQFYYLNKNIVEDNKTQFYARNVFLDL